MGLHRGAFEACIMHVGALWFEKPTSKNQVDKQA